MDDSQSDDAAKSRPISSPGSGVLSNLASVFDAYRTSCASSGRQFQAAQGSCINEGLCFWSVVAQLFSPPGQRWKSRKERQQDWTRPEKMSRLTSTSAILKRQRGISAPLGHLLTESVRWIESFIEEPMPDVHSFEYDLANGVVLAKVG